MTFTVYALIKDNEPVYVGLTSRPIDIRLVEHRSRKKLDKTVKIKEISTFKTLLEARECEEKMIRELGTLGKMNIFADYCGKVTVGKRRVLTDEEKKSFGQRWIGRKDLIGRKFTEEQKNNLRKALRGIKKNPELKDKFLEKSGAKYFDLYVNSTYYGRFINQTKAAKAIGMAKSTFVDIFKGKRKKNKGIRIEICD